MTIENLQIETSPVADVAHATVSLTTGNEKKAKKALATVSSLPFDSDGVFKVVGTVPATGIETVAALKIFAEKTVGLDFAAGRRGTIRDILRSLRRAYENPGTMNQQEIASVVASGVQNLLFQACWNYCQKFNGCKIPLKNDGKRGSAKKDFVGAFQAAVSAALDPVNPEVLTEVTEKTALSTIDLSDL